MFKALKARMFQGYRTGSFPKTEPVLPDRFAGRPRWDKALCTACGKCVSACPVNAVTQNDGKVTVDTGKCIFCRDCEENCHSGALVRLNFCGSSPARWDFQKKRSPGV